MSAPQVHGSRLLVADPEFSARKPLAFCALVLSLLLFGFGGWAMLATLSGAVITSGVVGVLDNRMTVQHPDGGVIVDIRAREGARVDAGDLLMRLDDRALTDEYKIVLTHLVELHARTARLRAERDNAETVSLMRDIRNLLEHDSSLWELPLAQTQLFEARRTALDQAGRQITARIAQIEAFRSGLHRQHSALLRQSALTNEQIATQQALEVQGLARRAPLLALMSDAAHLEGRIAALDAELATASERSLELRQSLDMLQLSRREDAETALQDISPRIIELEARRAALETRIASMELRAPASGVVHGLAHTTPGAVLRPAETALAIVPSDWPLLVVARLAPDHLDQVYLGQRARLHPASADMRSSAPIEGEVTQISADAFEDSQSGARYFRLEVAITDLPEAPGAIGLKPGMPVEVFLATKERSPMTYLLAPLNQFLAHALREG